MYIGQGRLNLNIIIFSIELGFFVASPSLLAHLEAAPVRGPVQRHVRQTPEHQRVVRVLSQDGFRHYHRARAGQEFSQTLLLCTLSHQVKVTLKAAERNTNVEKL